MSTVQFDPKIMPEFQIDWRRPSSQGADAFGEQLKRHAETDQRPRASKLRDEAADPLSGRPPRVVIAHPRTLRGEAKRVEEADLRLPDRSRQARAEGCAEEQEDATLEVGASADAEVPEQAAVPVEAEADAPAEEQVAVAEGEVDVEIVEPAAPVVVSVQSTPEADVDGEAAVAATPLPVATEDGILPGHTDEAANNMSSNGEADSKASTEEQPVAMVAETGLTEDVAALMTRQPAPAAGATPAAVTAHASALPPAPAKSEQPLLQMAEPPAPVAEPAPPAPLRTERVPMDIKLRASAPARPAPVAQPSPAAAPATQSAQPTTALQPTTGSEFTSMGEPFEQGLFEDGTGQGWALHLAQGAAGKRPDFVAQLRQHLQNLPAHEQVAVHLQRAVREGTNKFSIQLSPAELGNIHVKLEIDEEKRVTAAVTVERPSTLELLQRDTRGLERALHNAGLNMEGGDLSFSLGRGDRDFAQDLRQSGASAADGSVLDAETDGDQPESPAAQVMDTAAGVVNLQV